MNVMDLVAKISLDSNEYEKGVGNAKTSFSNLGSSIASGAKTIAKVGVAAFAAIGTAIGGATTALIKNASETAAYADNIDKMSQKMGFTAEKFQEWDFIMQHNGSSIEAVKGAMMKLDKSLESGSEAYEKLGLSQEALMNMSADEKFEATVKALQGVTDETEKAALAEEVFGKSYQEMMPLLNQTAEETEAMKQQVHDLGGVMSDDAVKAGAAYQDSLTNLKTALSGAKNSLMSEFLPSLTSVMDGLTALFTGDESGIGKVKEGIESFASSLNEKLPQVIQTVGGIANSLISALPSLLETVAEQLPSIFEDAIPIVINAFVALSDSIVKALPKLLSAIQSNIGTISSGVSKIISAVGKIILQLAPSLLPMMLQVGMELITELATGFSQNADSVIQTIFELVNLMVTMLSDPETLTQLLNCGIMILQALISGISDNLPLLLEAAGTLLGNLVVFLADAVPDLVVEIGKMGATVVTDILPQILTSIGTAVASMILAVSDGISDKMIELKDKASEFFGKIPEALMEGLAYLAVQIGNFAQSAIDFFGNGFAKIKDVGTALVQGIWNGISDAKDWVLSKIESFGDSIVSGIKGIFGISSPSKVMKDQVGKYLAEGIAVGFEDEADNTFSEIQDSLDDGMNGLDIDPIDLSTTANVAIKKNKMEKSATENKMDKLLEMMHEFMNNRNEENIFYVQIGNKVIDELIVDSKDRVTVRSGGQVNV